MNPSDVLKELTERSSLTKEEKLNDDKAYLLNLINNQGPPIRQAHILGDLLEVVKALDSMKDKILVCYANAHLDDEILELKSCKLCLDSIEEIYINFGGIMASCPGEVEKEKEEKEPIN